MHRIDTTGSVGGQFSEGNPGLGQPATKVGADWPNAVQEAICEVIETAGITLAKGDNTQLYDAIQVLITGGKNPPGTIIAFGGATAPDGYLPCDGSTAGRSAQAALFAAIGTTWGSGNGTTTFNVPNLNRKALVGSGGTGTGALGNAVGNTGGAESQTLDSTQMPSHFHLNGTADDQNVLNVYGGVTTDMPGMAASAITTEGLGGTNYQGKTSTVGGTAGVAQPVSIIQPSAVVLYCIKA